ncbi:Fc.00g083570.m01.CDS01 [Cosmosporella sp. VM-42]
MARRRTRGSGAYPAPAPTDSTSPAPLDTDDEALPPFFNTTFSTHRVSPLYIGPEALTATRLEALAHRLRDTLVGDVVRGIQVGLEATDTPMGQVGPLKAVRIRWFKASSILGAGPTFQRLESHDLSSEAQGNNWAELSDKQKQGLWIEIRHENAAYVALLLPGLSSASSAKGPEAEDWTMQSEASHRSVGINQDHFYHLPLLLLRMPLPLKNVLSDWLSAAFDCRISKMTLGTHTIISVWERWVKAAGLPDRGPDFVVTLAFNSPLPDAGNAVDTGTDDETMDNHNESGLRSMDITISPQDLRRFVRAGATIQPTNSTSTSTWEHDPRERRRLAGGNSDDGWAWRSNKQTTYPFTEALGRYLDHHLALNLFHPSVRITQISCAGFVLGQSRLKILKIGEMSTEFHHAAWLFVAQLGEKTQGGDLPRVFSTKG